MKTFSAGELSQLLSDYLDGTLGTREQADLEEYLTCLDRSADFAF